MVAFTIILCLFFIFCLAVKLDRLKNDVEHQLTAIDLATLRHEVLKLRDEVDLQFEMIKELQDEPDS